MTVPPASDDEVVSAVVDGEATTEERARVEGDPLLAARAAQFRRVSSAVAAEVEPLPADVASQLLRTALAQDPAVADHRTDAAGPAITAPPAPLPTRRRRRSLWVPGSAVAAAIIVVLAVVGLALIATSGGDKQDSATKAGTAAEIDRSSRSAGKATTGGANADASAAPTSTAPPGTGGAAVPFLGAFADQAALTKVLATVDLTTLEPVSDSVPSGPATNEPSLVAVDRCDQAIRAVPAQDLGGRLAVATAVLGGRRVLVYSHPDRGALAATPVTRLTVADAQSCMIRFAVQR